MFDKDGTNKGRAPSLFGGRAESFFNTSSPSAMGVEICLSGSCTKSGSFQESFCPTMLAQQAEQIVVQHAEIQEAIRPNEKGASF